MKTVKGKINKKTKTVKGKINKKKEEKVSFIKSPYAVVKFIEEKNKLFESIPESWFINEEKTTCYWPPKGGRSVTLRAMSQDVPDGDWEVCECTVVSLGHGKFYIIFLVRDDGM